MASRACAAGGECRHAHGRGQAAGDPCACASAFHGSSPLNRVLDAVSYPPPGVCKRSKSPDSTLAFLNVQSADRPCPEHRASRLPPAPFAHPRARPRSQRGVSSTPWPRPWPSTATGPRSPRWWRGRACRARPSTQHFADKEECFIAHETGIAYASAASGGEGHDDRRASGDRPRLPRVSEERAMGPRRRPPAGRGEAPPDGAADLRRALPGAQPPARGCAAVRRGTGWWARCWPSARDDGLRPDDQGCLRRRGPAIDLGRGVTTGRWPPRPWCRSRWNDEPPRADRGRHGHRQDEDAADASPSSSRPPACPSSSPT